MAKYKCPSECKATLSSITVDDNNYGKCNQGAIFELKLRDLDPVFEVIKPCPRCSLKVGMEFPAISIEN